MRAVNLLPRELLPQQSALPRYAPYAGAAAVPVIALVLVFVGYSRAHSAVTSDQAQLAAVQAEATAASSRAVPATASADTTLATQRSQRLSALQTVLAHQIPWDVSLNQLARALPAGVWLSSLTATSPSPESSLTTSTATTPATTTTTPTSTTPAPATPTTAAATSFTITGYASTEAGVALLLQHLQLLPSLTNVTLGSTTQSTVGTESVVQFTVQAAVQAQTGGQR